MHLKAWEKLPANMRNEAVRAYYNVLKKHTASLVIKRIFDVVMSLTLMILLSPVMLIIALAICLDTRGGVFFRQERVTQYGRAFHIHKFRTMVSNAESLGSQVTVAHDARVTKVGKALRGCRLDELPQLIDIFIGSMSFVGTRPEVSKYVNRYTPEMMATLLLPAGVTSEASICFKDEDCLLNSADNVDDVYVKKVLPRKMYYNLKSIYRFSLIHELHTMLCTVLAVCGKNYPTNLKQEDAFWDGATMLSDEIRGVKSGD